MICRKRIVELTLLSALACGDVSYRHAAASTLRPLDSVYCSALRFIPALVTTVSSVIIIGVCRSMKPWLENYHRTLHLFTVEPIFNSLQRLAGSSGTSYQDFRNALNNRPLPVLAEFVFWLYFPRCNLININEGQPLLFPLRNE